MVIITQNTLESFGNWLAVQKYQTNTIRNYLLDLKYFLDGAKNILSVDTITDFIARDTGQNNHARHLASVSKFCQFCLDQQIIDHNFFSLAKKRAYNPPQTRDLDLLLNQFGQSLLRNHKSPLTVKSYLGDIRQYIKFCESKTL